MHNLKKEIAFESIEVNMLLSDYPDVQKEAAKMLFERMSPQDEADYMEYSILTPAQKQDVNRKHFEDILQAAEIETKKLLRFIAKKYPEYYSGMMQEQNKEFSWLDWQQWSIDHFINILQHGKL